MLTFSRISLKRKCPLVKTKLRSILGFPDSSQWFSYSPSLIGTFLFICFLMTRKRGEGPDYSFMGLEHNAKLGLDYCYLELYLAGLPWLLKYGSVELRELGLRARWRGHWFSCTLSQSSTGVWWDSLDPEMKNSKELRTQIFDFQKETTITAAVHSLGLSLRAVGLGSVTIAG